jgi:hypothetical protein
MDDEKFEFRSAKRTRKELREIIVQAYTEKAILFAGLCVALGVIADQANGLDCLNQIYEELMDRLYEGVSCDGIDKTEIEHCVRNADFMIESIFDFVKKERFDIWGRHMVSNGGQPSYYVPQGMPVIAIDWRLIEPCNETQDD